MDNIQTEQENSIRQSTQLNSEQKTAYDTIIYQINTASSMAQFFIQGPACTGKTFLYKCLCHYY